ncbi:MAG: LysR family transcriptional regulator [Burkholderiales bacterium]|nr:LysR family transcriptional regulator [Burkholderiales bacterium]
MFIPFMYIMHLRNLDLNLLTVLDAVVEARNVTRAAQRLHLSQSAVSHALTRLRRAFGDPLLVRGSDGMAPTPLALRLAGPVRDALATLQTAVGTLRTFDPATTTDTFRVGATDYGELLLLPGLAEAVRRAAPQVRILTQPIRQETLGEDLATGRIDVAVGFVRHPPADTHAVKLLDERYACLARRDWRGALTLRRYLDARHLQVSPSGTLSGPADEALARLGTRRNVVFATPHFTSGAGIVARTDLLMTTPARVARTFAREMPLRVLAPPFEIPPIALTMMWSARTHRDAGQRWLREALGAAARGL